MLKATRHSDHRVLVLCNRALNRTLILPRFWAWCEMDQVATVLETCRKDGGDQVLPFQTPADYLLSFWALPSSPLSYREYSFLDNPRAGHFPFTCYLLHDTSLAKVHADACLHGCGSYTALWGFSGHASHLLCEMSYTAFVGELMHAAVHMLAGAPPFHCRSAASQCCGVGERAPDFCSWAEHPGRAKGIICCGNTGAPS